MDLSRIPNETGLNTSEQNIRQDLLRRLRYVCSRLEELTLPVTPVVLQQLYPSTTRFYEVLEEISRIHSSIPTQDRYYYFMMLPFGLIGAIVGRGLGIMVIPQTIIKDSATKGLIGGVLLFSLINTPILYNYASQFRAAQENINHRLDDTLLDIDL